MAGCWDTRNTRDHHVKGNNTNLKETERDEKEYKDCVKDSRNLRDNLDTKNYGATLKESKELRDSHRDTKEAKEPRKKSKEFRDSVRNSKKSRDPNLERRDFRDDLGELLESDESEVLKSDIADVSRLETSRDRSSEPYHDRYSDYVRKSSRDGKEKVHTSQPSRHSTPCTNPVIQVIKPTSLPINKTTCQPYDTLDQTNKPDFRQHHYSHNQVISNTDTMANFGLLPYSQSNDELDCCFPGLCASSSKGRY